MTKSRKLKLSCAMLIVIALATVSPTLAWLSATTEPVVNYFAGGAIALKIDEAPVDVEGKAIEGDRVQENHYKYVAGAELDKDPTVTVLANSEDCYVYVCVDNQLPSSLFDIDLNASAWDKVSESGTMTIYRYSTVVESSASDRALTPVFTKVEVSESLTTADIEELGTKTLAVTAFAIQAASLDAATADGLAEAYFYEGANVASLEATGAAAESVGTTESGTETGAQGSVASAASTAHAAAANREGSETGSETEPEDEGAPSADGDTEAESTEASGQAGTTSATAGVSSEANSSGVSSDGNDVGE